MDHIDVTHLQEPIALDMIQHIDQFDSVVMEAYQEMEPHIMVKYLLKLG